MNRIWMATLLVATQVACDKVEFPLPKPPDTVIDTTVQFPVIDTAKLNITLKKLLVEEFTGHRCTGCPTQTKKLLAMQEEKYPNVIVLSYHAGDFAKTNAQYPNDLTTPHGNAILDRISNLGGYPSAQVNRSVYNAGKIFLGHEEWKNPIDAWAGKQSADLAVGIAADFDSEAGAFKIRVSIKAINGVSGEHRLVVVCTEDSVVSPQLDRGVFVPDYVHRHTVRGSVNAEANVYGEVVITPTGLAADEWIDKRFVYPKPDKVLEPAQCYFTAYLINTASEEIVQSEECRVHVD